MRLPGDFNAEVTEYTEARDRGRLYAPERVCQPRRLRLQKMK